MVFNSSKTKSKGPGKGPGKGKRPPPVNRDMKPKLSCEISYKLHREFREARWLMMALGKFPFKTKKLV